MSSTVTGEVCTSVCRNATLKDQGVSFLCFVILPRYCHRPHQSLRWKRAETLLLVSGLSRDTRVGGNKPFAIMVPPNALRQETRHVNDNQFL